MSDAVGINLLEDKISLLEKRLHNTEKCTGMLMAIAQLNRYAPRISEQFSKAAKELGHESMGLWLDANTNTSEKDDD